MQLFMWTDDIAKLKDLKDSEFTNIWILGENLSIANYKYIETLSKTIPIRVESISGMTKVEAEIAFLWHVAMTEKTICFLHKAEKRTLEIAQQLGVEITSPSNISAIPKPVKTRKPKQDKKPSTVQTTDTSKVDNMITKIMKKAGCTELIEEKELCNVRKAYKEASDVQFGLPLLMKLYCQVSEEMANKIAEASKNDFVIIQRQLADS